MESHGKRIIAIKRANNGRMDKMLVFAGKDENGMLDCWSFRDNKYIKIPVWKYRSFYPVDDTVAKGLLEEYCFLHRSHTCEYAITDRLPMV